MDPGQRSYVQGKIVHEPICFNLYFRISSLYLCRSCRRPSGGTTIPVTTRAPRRYCPQEFCREASVEWTRGRTRRLIMYEHSYHISIGESDIAAFQRGITYATIVKDLSGFLCPWRRLLELWPRSIESRMCRKSNGFSRFLSAFTPNCGGYAAPA